MDAQLKFPLFERLSSPWSQDPRRDELLRQLHATKASFSEIAFQINKQTGSNLTRNAVIGRSKRIKLPRREEIKPGPKPRGQGVDGALSMKIRTRPTRVSYLPLQQNKNPIAAMPFLNLTLMELGTSQCRYPQGGDSVPTFFCGQLQMDGQSYCEFHYRLCYTKPPPFKPKVWIERHK